MTIIYNKIGWKYSEAQKKEVVKNISFQNLTSLTSVFTLLLWAPSMMLIWFGFVIAGGNVR